ncbi:CRISPR-associated ring nuclease Csm6 [Pseudoalteromonas sp. S558]|uniref:CRISPR-associated ring nuclease Csm6 n=1 Tax=Pseudoalteromonas sp. S558 TaxID=2066515 RepID=UPI00110C0471|nr:CRISPR-associated ring nuclease Csm6 [Pseudoalteromonas sp. S558]TMO02087.1 TIGR02584 family CRISPR-associated protein [Pseudoalteromonas sp. S558]
MKNVLLIVTGASPQVLTETLFALYQQGKPIPEEIFVITTKSTKVMLTDGLFKQSHLAQLIADYQLPNINLPDENIWLIEDDKGQPINDAKSEIEQTYMADFITRKVFELTNKNDISIHASIAGGRKTMAFYLGYAMSLLGREQDSLSHVFVNDEFEFVKDFYYPTPYSQVIDGKNGAQVDCINAKVTLAEIPFVRMRQSIDETLIANMQSASFSQTVASLNSAHKKDLTLEINVKAKILTFAGIEIKLTAKETAFYLWLHQYSQSEHKRLIVGRKFEECTKHSIEYLTLLQKNSSDLRVFRDTFGVEPEDFRDGLHSNLKVMEKTFVQQTRSRINNKINKFLPNELAKKIAIDSNNQSFETSYWLSAATHNIKINITA